MLGKVSTPAARCPQITSAGAANWAFLDANQLDE
jgi:hypothetical protein